MPEIDGPAAMKEALDAAGKRGARLLGFDVGEKSIGLALSDGSRLVASPLETIRRRKFTVDAERVAAICAEHTVGGLVIGLPVNMDGSEGPRAQSTRAPSFRLLYRRPKAPGRAECEANPRARSARLRAAERTEAPAWPAEVAA